MVASASRASWSRSSTVDGVDLPLQPRLRLARRRQAFREPGDLRAQGRSSASRERFLGRQGSGEREEQPEEQPAQPRGRARSPESHRGLEVLLPRRLRSRRAAAPEGVEEEAISSAASSIIFALRLAAAVAGPGLDADQHRRFGPPARACSAAANLKLCAGTTRSSWSAVVISVGG